VILSGGLHTAQATREAFDATGASAVMLARGSLGNPWLFEELLERRSAPPSDDEVLRELDWVIARASEHLGTPRATRYLRRFYPWYLERLALERASARRLSSAVQQAESFTRVRELLAAAVPGGAVSAERVLA
jgi:tRNA-dihydrouridine synthase B